jgi:hypothetical protein
MRPTQRTASQSLHSSPARPGARAALLLAIALSAVACADVFGSDAGARPGPFTFMYGLDHGGRLSDLQELGLNTLYIDLRPDELGDLDPVRTQIRETAAAGYKVIVGIPTTGAERGISATSDTYRAWVEGIISTIVLGLKDEPGVTAWATGHYLEKSISYPDGEFQDFLRNRYGSLDALNRYWRTDFRGWAAVGQTPALEPIADIPFGVGRSAVDVADYRTDAFGAVMRHWARTISQLDDSRPLVTGSISLYRSLPAVPDLYDVIAVTFPPDIMTPDPHAYGDHVTHNAHGIDMARRGGRFEVIQVLRIPFPWELGYGSGLRDWILEADIHGACGVGLESWERIEYEPDIWALTRRPLEQVLPLVDFSGRPRPTIAVIYSPYSEGFAVAGQPVYGHLAGFATGETSTLVEALRAGTCFGPVDYLTTADLTHVPLERYGAIIAPAALGLSLETSGLLAEYVRSGGALLADLGIGLHTTGDWRYLPEPLAAAFGVRAMGEIKARAGTLSVTGSVPWLPHVVRGMKSKGSFRARMPGGERGRETYQAGSYAVGSYAGYAALMQGATAVAVLDVDNSTPETPLFAGIIGTAYGRGLAVFATHPLYQHWPLSDPLSAALHYDILGRGRACRLVGEPLIPATTEISVEADRIRVLNASTEHRRVVIDLHSGDDRLVGNALTVNHAAYTAGEANQQIEVSVPPNSLAGFPTVPIRLQPYADDVAAVVAEFSQNRVQLSVAAPGAALAPTRAQPYHFSRPTHPIQVRFEVRSGGEYRLADGSVHAVTMQTERGRTRNFDIVAKGGALSFTEEVYREMVTIEPRHPAP